MYGAISLSSLYVTVVTSTSLSAMFFLTSSVASRLISIILNGSIRLFSGFTGVSTTATSSATTSLASATSVVNSSPSTLFDASIVLAGKNLFI